MTPCALCSSPAIGTQARPDGERIPVCGRCAAPGQLLGPLAGEAPSSVPIVSIETMRRLASPPSDAMDLFTVGRVRPSGADDLARATAQLHLDTPTPNRARRRAGAKRG